jgi:TPR repeat protein
MVLRKKFTLFIGMLTLATSAAAQLLPNDELSILIRKAESGDPVSQLTLSECYGLGKLGVQRNVTKAIYWTEKAAHGSNLDISRKAGFKLAFLFTYGVEELDRPKDALFWSEKTYREGNTAAMIMCSYNHRRLGNIKMAYQYAIAEARWSQNRGKVEKVESEYEKLLTPAVREICRKEAEALDPLKMMEAQANEVMVKSLALIATSGDADSQYELGMHHLDGTMGLPKNREKAVNWLRRAAANGHQKAIKKLAEIDGAK